MSRFASFLGSAMFCAAIVLAPSQSFSDITVARLFSDHMVLQQLAQVKIWGTANPNEKVIISFNGQDTLVTANATGKWEGVLNTPAAGGPYTIEIRAEAGEPKITLADVLVGEVWICSGQSNMEWPIEKADSPEREIAGAKDYPNIRLFNVNHNAVVEPITDLVNAKGWDVCNPESVRLFSATAYFFGRRLNQELKIPIGLVKTTWGGTPAEAWTSREVLESAPKLKPLLEHWTKNDNAGNPNRPSSLYNGMISPLKGLKFRGAIWYQGESNAKRAVQYRTIFPLMIEDWRKQLAGGEEFPFYFVQIAPFRYKNNNIDALAELWDSQTYTYRMVPNTGMVVTTDIAELADIHPRNKQDVGARLAGWALAGCYKDKLTEANRQLVPSGPIYRSKEIRGKEIRLNFDFVAKGLVAKDNAELNWFTICGPDKKFVPAKAKIDGEQVVVWADEVAEPQEVRFAWNDSAIPNLFNSEGLPASPFRTDSFPLLSEGEDF
jgi:sialate O-acetylesterase